MTLAAILEIIQGVLKFPDSILQLVRVLQATPAEQHQAIILSVQAQSDNYKKTGRPQWGI